MTTIMFFCRIAGNNDDGWSQWACKIVHATTNLVHWCGSTTSMIAKVQGARDKIDQDTTTTTLMTQKSCLYVVSQGVMTIKQQMRGEKEATPMLQSNFHVVVCRTRQRPYCATWWSAAQIRQGQVQHLRWRWYVHCQRCVLAKDEDSEYSKDSVYVPKGKYGKYSKEAAFVEEGNNNPLATKG